MYTNNIDEVIDKYSESVIKHIDKNNFYKILKFLIRENCDYIEDIISDYLDLFILKYDDFIEKYSHLNMKYNNNFLNKASEDMNLFEEFYMN